MKLSTIQKRNNLNVVCSDDKIGPGGAYHNYLIGIDDPENGAVEPILFINFQKGPCKDPTSVRGVLDTDLLEIVRNRLQMFQAGEFACRENACALTALEECLMWMNKRVEDRAERQVLGTYDK